MPDVYLTDTGSTAFTEGAADSPTRIFKPFFTEGGYTVYEEQSAKALAPAATPPPDNWDC